MESESCVLIVRNRERLHFHHRLVAEPRIPGIRQRACPDERIYHACHWPGRCELSVLAVDRRRTPLPRRDARLRRAYMSRLRCADLCDASAIAGVEE